MEVANRRPVLVSCLFPCAVAVCLAVHSPRAAAEDFYVAPDGAASNPGTRDKPFGTIEQVQAHVSPGDTVYVRGGIYRFSGTTATVGVSFTKSGTENKPIRYFAAPGEVPIFDLFELKPQARVTGFDVRCSWIHIRGMEIRGVRQLIVGDSWSVRIRGDHNVIEQFNVHDGEAPGIFIASGASNLILNCDSHHNYDPLEDGGNADGFGCHSSGGDNVLRGCRAYENSDDGFDFINAPGTCTVEDSWSFRNGFVPDTTMPAMNGAGFKSGGFGLPPNIPATGVPRHVVRRNLAFGNRVVGVYANHHPGGIDFFNNTAFDNPANFNMIASGTSSHKLRNNLAVEPGRAITNFNGGTDTNNSWTLPVTVAAADFLGMDRTQALLPRQADGSLPNIAFMHPAPDSDLIDRGEDVGLPFGGKAPDLGAFEPGLPATVGSMDAGVPDAAVAVDASLPTSGAAGMPPATTSGQPMAMPGQPGPGVGGSSPQSQGGKPLTPTAAGAGQPAPSAGLIAGSGGGQAPVTSQAPSAQPQSCGCRLAPASADSESWFGWSTLAGLAALARRRRARYSGGRLN
jgi:hypothetical protein